MIDQDSRESLQHRIYMLDNENRGLYQRNARLMEDNIELRAELDRTLTELLDLKREMRPSSEPIKIHDG